MKSYLKISHEVMICPENRNFSSGKLDDLKKGNLPKPMGSGKSSICNDIDLAFYDSIKPAVTKKDTLSPDQQWENL